jgi:hypothetical protein
MRIAREELPTAEPARFIEGRADSSMDNSLRL